MINEGVFSDLNFKEKNHHAHTILNAADKEKLESIDEGEVWEISRFIL